MKAAFSKVGRFLLKIGRACKKPWVFTGLILGVLAVLVWLVGPLIYFGDSAPLSPLAPRIAIIIALSVLWLMVLLISFLVRDNADDAPDAKQIAETIEAEQARNALCDRLIQRFERQMAVLRDHMPGKRSGRYAYHLPWYLVAGLPDSGKTSLLVRCGQDYPLSQLMETNPLAGISASTDFSCWVSNDALFIDTPGALIPSALPSPVAGIGGGDQAKEDSGSLMWSTLCRLLNRYRNRRPINGLILVVSLEDLLFKSEHERALVAQALRHRILDLSKRLGTRFPIYLVVSKMDMLAGFMEFFADFKQRDREQVWGITFPVQPSRLVPGAQEVWRDVLSQQYSALTNRLNERLLKRLYDERDPRQRALIYGFPQRFGGLQSTIETFIGQIFSVDSYTTPPLLRGLYLVSNTQSGMPLDPLMGVVSAAFDVERPPLAAHRSQIPFFSQQLFSKAVLLEAGLASDNRLIEHRKSLVNGLAYAGCAALIAGCSWTWWNNYQSSIGMLGTISSKIDAYHASRIASPSTVMATVDGLSALRTIRDVFATSDDWVMSGLALSSTNDLVEVSAEAYRAALQRDFSPWLAERLSRDLQDSINGGVSSALLKTLSHYLMMAMPERLSTPSVRKALQILWRTDYTAAPQTQQALLTLFDDWATGNRHSVALQQPLVRQARHLLSTTPRSEQIYSELKREGETTLVDGIDVSRNIGPYFARIFDDPRRDAALTAFDKDADGWFVPRLFTSDGWSEFVFPTITALSVSSVSDSWITGDLGSGPLTGQQLHDVQRAVGDHYVQDYIDHWRTLLNNLTVTRIETLDEAAEVLEILSGPSSPFTALIALVEQQTTLSDPTPPPPEAAAEGEAQASALPKAPGKAGAAQAKLGRAAKAADALFPKTGEGENDDQPLPAGQAEALPTLAAFFAPVSSLNRPEGTSPTHMDNVRQAVGDLYTFSREILDAPNPEQAAFDVVRARADDKVSTPVVALRKLANHSPAPLRSWLTSLADQTWAVILKQAQVHLVRHWNTDVYAPWKEHLAGRFPLDPTAQSDAAIDDVATILGPQGNIETFYNAYLRPFVDPQTGQPRSIDGQTLSISDNTLAQIRRARALRTILFPNGKDRPSLSFTVRPARLDPSVAQAILDVDGQQVEYRHGPPTTIKIAWPSEAVNNQAELRFQEIGPYGRILRETTVGQWAWLRLMQRGRLQSTDGQQRLEFSLAGRSISFDLWMDRQVNPLGLTSLPSVALEPTL